ncbi:MAG TPA: glycosyltransferase [Solirubrobacterales bacterium]|nr:glycosyltransferase [Solirubrobacterales bacterium]
MLLHKDIAHDSRVRREAGALAGAGHEVTVVHLPPSAERELPGLPYALTPATLRRGRERLPHAARLGAEATRLALRAAATWPDAIHAHDAAMLLPGLLAARRCGSRLVYDSHELATGVPYRGGAWPAVVAGAERLGAPRADAVIAVSDGIAARLSERYRLRRPPAVIRNLPDLPPPDAAPAPDLRRALGIGDAPLVLHQGAVAAGRGCEVLLRALDLLPEAHLLYLGAEGPYATRMRRIAGESGAADRSHFLGPVPPEALLSYTAQADVGVSLLADSCENHRLALPNKLFEYVAAGLPVVVSDLPEASRLVRAHGIGWCADGADPESVAVALRTALAQQNDEGLRERLARAATELSWEREKQSLLAVYDALGR